VVGIVGISCIEIPQSWPILFLDLVAVLLTGIARSMSRHLDQFVVVVNVVSNPIVGRPVKQRLEHSCSLYRTYRGLVRVGVDLFKIGGAGNEGSQSQYCQKYSCKLFHVCAALKFDFKVEAISSCHWEGSRFDAFEHLAALHHAAFRIVLRPMAQAEQIRCENAEGNALNDLRLCHQPVRQCIVEARFLELQERSVIGMRLHIVAIEGIALIISIYVACDGVVRLADGISIRIGPHYVDSVRNEAVIASFEGILQLALVTEDGVSHWIAVSAPLVCELACKRKVLVT